MELFDNREWDGVTFPVRKYETTGHLHAGNTIREGDHAVGDRAPGVCYCGGQAIAIFTADGPDAWWIRVWNLSQNVYMEARYFGNRRNDGERPFQLFKDAMDGGLEGSGSMQSVGEFLDFDAMYNPTVRALAEGEWVVAADYLRAYDTQWTEQLKGRQTGA